MIRIIAKIPGYLCCGVAHADTPVEWPDTQFNDEQLAVLRTNRLLQVKRVAEPVVPADVINFKADALKRVSTGKKRD